MADTTFFNMTYVTYFMWYYRMAHVPKQKHRQQCQLLYLQSFEILICSRWYRIQIRVRIKSSWSVLFFLGTGLHIMSPDHRHNWQTQHTQHTQHNTHIHKSSFMLKRLVGLVLNCFNDDGICDIFVYDMTFGNAKNDSYDFICYNTSHIHMYVDK